LSTPARLPLPSFLAALGLLGTTLLAGGARAEPPGVAAAGQAIFTQNCVVCHGAGGKGDGIAAAGLNPKPANFNDAVRMAAAPEERRRKVVREGGASIGLSAAMPAFKETLSEQDIRDVLAYVRATFTH
jgi:mono/diheme cytochrome c family protein